MRRISSDSSGSTCRTARASTIAPTVRLSSSTVRSRASSAAADGGRAAPWGCSRSSPRPWGAYPHATTTRTPRAANDGPCRAVGVARAVPRAPEARIRTRPRHALSVSRTTARAAPSGLLAQFPAPLRRVSARDHDTHWRCRERRGCSRRSPRPWGGLSVRDRDSGRRCRPRAPGGQKVTRARAPCAGHRVEGRRDAVQGDAVRDQGAQVEGAGADVGGEDREVAGGVGVAVDAAGEGAAPVEDLQGVEGDLLVLAADADDRGASAAPGGLPGGADGARTADALHRHVHALLPGEAADLAGGGVGGDDVLRGAAARASSSFSGETSTATIVEAPAMRADWSAARPTLRRRRRRRSRPRGRGRSGGPRRSR